MDNSFSLKNKNAKTFFVIFFTIVLLASFIGFLPPLRSFILSLMEKNVLHRAFRKPDHWMKILFSFFFSTALISFITLFILLTEYGKNIFFQVTSNIKEVFSKLLQYKKHFFITFAFLFVAYLPLFYANVYQVPIDDLRRMLTGIRSFMNFYRYIDEFFGILMHTNLKFVDIAPLTQIFALLFLTLATISFASIFTNFKITFFSICASLPIGLSPWFFANMTYRIDSPWMALSILSIILPFLFAENRIAFIFVSVLGLLTMCMTYQTSAGIYVIMTIALAFYWWVSNKKNVKEIFIFIGIAALTFLITLAFFKILFMVDKDTGDAYVSTNVLPLKNLIPGTISNSIRYVKCLIHDVGKGAIGLCTVLVFILSVFHTTRYAKNQNKSKALLTLFLSIAVFLFCIVVSYGVLLAFEKPLFERRAFTGIGCALAIIGIFSITFLEQKHFFTKGLVTFFAYTFVAFAFMYANAQYAQHRYTEYRVQTLISDLNHFCAEPHNAEFQFSGNIGYAPLTRIPTKVYPLIRNNMVVNFEGNWQCSMIMQQYGFGRYTNDELNLEETFLYKSENERQLPLLLDTGLHTIYGNENNFYIVLKPCKDN